MIKEILNYVGYMGPIITSGITTIIILENTKYLIGFIIGGFLNYYLNGFIKLMIKQPRPTNPVHYIDDDLITGTQTYGMPSGHAQITTYALVFLYLINKTQNKSQNKTWLLLSVFVYGLTIYQRWSFRRHTLEQLAIGTIIGASFAQITYWTIKNIWNNIL
jgi:membrane-associated phospholipid phosphatase